MNCHHSMLSSVSIRCPAISLILDIPLDDRHTCDEKYLACDLAESFLIFQPYPTQMISERVRNKHKSSPYWWKNDRTVIQWQHHQCGLYISRWTGLEDRARKEMYHKRRSTVKSTTAALLLKSYGQPSHWKHRGCRAKSLLGDD